jgi:hypothetical protein
MYLDRERVGSTLSSKIRYREAFSHLKSKGINSGPVTRQYHNTDYSQFRIDPPTVPLKLV